ncbi:hypothetical protein CHS0354_014877 [Potamilus streckersoni]|uniref:Cyclic nucleotide-binding domain-containing protein n=1 Tax=Potamilus streckersoni TaxID=2493646 RepID=A0AAE0WF05_9BIVA|nr:hypothetical protein CHS0354_014877 [Potamilus streckersoni]
MATVSNTGSFRKRRTFKTSRNEAIFPHASGSLGSGKAYQPLVRFRRGVKMVQVLLKATKNNRQGQRNDLLSWAHYHDDESTARRAYDMFGISFDPSVFKANREKLISNEAKQILSLDQGDRTEEQLKTALLSLNQAVDAFGEFPIKMQRSLVRVARYERFEAKRVIIRQGHTADNFYFILSGTAVVTILETDKQTGDQIVRTVALLKKGNSFGELALMHGARRSATVTCKNDVELLAVGREDFIDIFMHVERDREPEHIMFLRSIDILHGWPIEKLPYDNPKICLFTYFRRGVLLCKDSNHAEWIYVIRSGACRVLKDLHATKPIASGVDGHLSPREAVTKFPPIHPSRSTSSDSSSPDSDSPKPFITNRNKAAIRSRRQLIPCKGLPPIRQNTEELLFSATEHKKILEEEFNKRHLEKLVLKKVTIREANDENQEHMNMPKKRRLDKVFVQIQKLGPKDTFGLEHAAFSVMGRTTGCSLVSDGAECVLINKTFFLQHLTDDVAKRIRRTIQPIPTEESLQQKLQDKTNWEAFKSKTVAQYFMYKRQLQDYDSLFY